MPKFELECPKCDAAFTGDTKEEALEKRKEHGRKHHKEE